MGFQLGLLQACFITTAIYFQSPVAQLPNRGTLQATTWEQGFKNHIDKKYGLYNEADRAFFDNISPPEEKARLRKEILASKALQDREMRRLIEELQTSEPPKF